MGRRLRLAWFAGLAGSGVFAFAGVAAATPGPDSVAVLANADIPESGALADAYAAARDVPARQVCKLSMPATDDISLADYQTAIDGPFEACLKDAGVLDRIEAVVVMRGVPLRVAIPVGNALHNASLAATLSVWRSTLTADSSPLLGQDPGQIVDCGSPCLGAKYVNPLLYLNGPFGPGYDSVRAGVDWKILLVTMLTGRSYADGQMLIQSAMDAEKNGGAKGTFLFMDGADSARGALDGDYPTVISSLKSAGYTDAEEVPFDANLTGKTLAGFFTGTASIGDTIEGNTYLPGALVDNLTSFGAVPKNFASTGETQVSISRWVEKGVGGVHGTVDEPLNNVFPSRYLMVDYVKGATLAEAYFRRLPYAYWRNLVVGDPMLAPYAKRPVVTITGVTDGQAVDAETQVTATATDTSGAGIKHVSLFVDGVLAGDADGDTVSACVTVPVKKGVQILAVAQTNTAAGALARFPPKGWAALHVDGGTGGVPTCPQAQPDGGMPFDEAGIGDDAGTGNPGNDGGCSCDAAGGGGSPWPALLLVPGLALLWVRRRTPPPEATPDA